MSITDSDKSLTVKWKRQICAEVRAMDNQTLLQETIMLAGGDDYDGCFTDQGSYRYIKLEDELFERLSKCGWLKE